MAVEDSWYTVDGSTGKKVPTKRHGRGKRWRVRNRGARTVSFDKRSDADAHDTGVKADLLKGVIPFDHAAGRVTFESYARKWLAEHAYDPNSRDTVASRLNAHLIPFFGDMRMCDIRPSTVTAWLAGLRTNPSKRTKRPLAARTIEAIWVLLVSIMKSAVIDKVVAVNPCDGVDRPKPGTRRVTVEIWEQDTVDTVLAALPDREHALGLLAATCGHRQGEAFAVAVGDVNFLRKQITIRHQVKRVGGQLALGPPKRAKVRTVPLPDVTGQALAAHLERYGTVTVGCQCCGTDHEILFSKRGHLHSHRDWNRDVWHPAVRAAGMTPSRATGLHQFRHYFASLLIDGGADPKQVQTYMGHASITVTMDIYGHLFERSHDRARSIVDAAFTANVAQRLASSGNAGAYPVRTGQDQ